MTDEDLAEGEIKLYHPHREGVSRVIQRSEITEIEDLLVEVYRDGSRVTPSPDLDEMRSRRIADLDRLDVGVRRLVNPHIYHVSLTERMKRLQLRLIDEARGR
jgi:nicotinate phosphoribosyltransferase